MGQSKAQNPDRPLGQIRETGYHSLLRFQNVPGVKNHSLSLRGQGQPGPALEKPHMVVLLQPLDVSGQTLLRNIQPVRGA